MRPRRYSGKPITTSSVAKINPGPTKTVVLPPYKAYIRIIMITGSKHESSLGDGVVWFTYSERLLGQAVSIQKYVSCQQDSLITVKSVNTPGR